MSTLDPWYQQRRQEFEEVVREFYVSWTLFYCDVCFFHCVLTHSTWLLHEQREETKHKQELMLNRLEKSELLLLLCLCKVLVDCI